MRKKRTVLCLILSMLVLLDVLVIVHVCKVKHKNEDLAEEWAAVNELAHQLRARGTASKQDPKEIENIIQELNFKSYLKHLEMEKDIIQLQLDGISQEQLFTFFRILSEKTKHRLVECSISQHGSQGLTLMIEIQLL